MSWIKWFFQDVTSFDLTVGFCMLLLLIQFDKLNKKIDRLQKQLCE